MNAQSSRICSEKLLDMLTQILLDQPFMELQDEFIEKHCSAFDEDQHEFSLEQSLLFREMMFLVEILWYGKTTLWKKIRVR